MAGSNQQPDVVFIHSLNDFHTALKDFEPNIGKEDPQGNPKTPFGNFLLWFRGQTEFTRPLIPSLFRRAVFPSATSPCGHERTRPIPAADSALDWNDLRAKEKNYLSDFRKRNYHFFPHTPENDLLWMIAMQHYGAPTRLLDWSENAFSALFFALEYFFTPDPKPNDSVPCVWCLKPKELNNTFLRLNDFQDIEDCFPDLFFSSRYGYLPEEEKNKIEAIRKIFFPENREGTKKPKYCPFAVIPPYNNDRIRAQSGTFTLFPFVDKTVHALEELSMEYLEDASKFLRLLILDKPFAISSELKALGIKRSQFYPEIPSGSYDIEQEQNLHLRL
jgi:hypothetical protein